MNPVTLPKILIGAAVALGLVGLLAFAAQSCAKGKVTQAETQANIASGEAHASQTQANGSDAKVADLQAKLDDKTKALGRLTSERLALLKRLDVDRQARLDAESAHPATADPVVDVRDAVIAKDAEVIEAQGTKIKGLEDLTSQLVISRDAWKASAEAREREAAGLRIALDAQKGVASSGKWLGRVQGFAIGIGVGYVGGRLR